MLDENIAVLAKFIDVSAARHKVAAHNIANINTEGFKRKEVIFESLLEDKNVHQASLETEPKVIEIEENDRIDDNSVSLEQEVGILTKNYLLQQMYLRALTFKIRGLNGAIQGHF